MSKAIDKLWETHWKNILQCPDGSIDVEQLKKELYDYSNMAERMVKLTCYITQERLSYPNYPVETLINIHKEVMEEDMEEILKDDKEDGFCSFCNQEIL